MIRQEEDRLSNLILSQQSALLSAIKMHAKSLTVSTSFCDSAIRLISIWFANCGNREASNVLLEELKDVPSAAFLGLSHQIIARYCKASQGDETSRFLGVLKQLVLRMCSDHPFHTMYHVYALCMSEQSPRKQGSHQDELSTRSSRTRSMNVDANKKMESSNSSTAHQILAAVGNKIRLTERINAFTRLCDAMYAFANIDPDLTPECKLNGKIKSGSVALSKSWVLSQLKSIDVPLPTQKLSIDPSTGYHDFISVQSYSATFSFAGGVHRPKIIDCIGSDGARYKQLVRPL